MVGVAVKVTTVPAHTVLPGVLVIVTAGVSELYTIIVTVLLVTVAGVAHVALLVRSQVTTSPLAKELLEKVGLPLPAGTPFTYH